MKTSSPIDEDPFSFAPVTPSQIDMVHQWLKLPHISEWIHGVGLQNTLNGIEAFLHGDKEATYWVGFHKSTPFAFLITFFDGKDAITLDLFICDLKYLGKGLAVPMIRDFLKKHFSHVNKVLIDPESSNSRAIHVYEKVGFKKTGEFIAHWHPVPHYQMELEMTKFLDASKEKQ